MYGSRWRWENGSSRVTTKSPLTVGEGMLEKTPEVTMSVTSAMDAGWAKGVVLKGWDHSEVHITKQHFHERVV